MKTQNTLQRMSEIIGVSGYEKTIREHIKELVACHSDVQVVTDKIGNLICWKKGKASDVKVMIIAHMDEVGFQVMSIDDDGSARLKVLGNVKTWNMLNQRVSTANGERNGIIYCENPEGIKAYDYSKLKVIPTKGHFEIGDVLGFDIDLIETECQWIGKALDNRISCFLLCKLLEAKTDNANDACFVFTTQEETGMRGSRVAVSALAPDVIIDIDVSPVGERNSLKMGDGVGIKLSDSVGISSENLVNRIEQFANCNGIKYQREVSDCGTSELIITNERDLGSERVGLSIPCKNMHSTMTIINKSDVEACEQLINIILNRGL